ncbi:hypothetical protein RYA05_05060 [Pseudomonas syringae pv. actinidiae]|nr:hypothetical protein [Pseudomonas syringae pv. actinidiae]
MKKIMTAVLPLLLGCAWIGFAPSAQAAYCKDKLSSSLAKIASSVCDQLDTTTPTIEQLKAAKNPLVYTNADAGGCDLGLSMPGLPAFGTNITGLDSCKILQAVTKESVAAANSKIQSGLDAALEKAKLDGGPTNIDLTKMVTDQVEANK